MPGDADADARWRRCPETPTPMTRLAPMPGDADSSCFKPCGISTCIVGDLLGSRRLLRPARDGDARQETEAAEQLEVCEAQRAEEGQVRERPDDGKATDLCF